MSKKNLKKDIKDNHLKKSCLSKTPLSMSEVKRITSLNKALKWYECEFCKRKHLTSKG